MLHNLYKNVLNIKYNSSPIYHFVFFPGQMSIDFTGRPIHLKNKLLIISCSCSHSIKHQIRHEKVQDLCHQIYTCTRNSNLHLSVTSRDRHFLFFIIETHFAMPRGLDHGDAMRRSFSFNVHSGPNVPLFST